MNTFLDFVFKKKAMGNNVGNILEQKNRVRISYSAQTSSVEVSNRKKIVMVTTNPL